MEKLAVFCIALRTHNAYRWPFKMLECESIFEIIWSLEGQQKFLVRFHILWIIIIDMGRWKVIKKRKEKRNLPQPLCCTFILLITTMELHLLFLIMAADIKLHRRLRLVWHRDLWEDLHLPVLPVQISVSSPIKLS